MNRQWRVSITIAMVAALTSLSCLSADDKRISEVFNVDRIVSDDLVLNFTNDRGIQPDISDFNVQHYVLMSNEKGDRRAVVTLENRSSGSRIFQSAQLMALMADGRRLSPQAYKQKFKAGERISMTLSFGSHVDPILKIYTRN